MKIDKSWYIKPSDPNFPTQQMAGGVVVRRERGKLLVALIGDKKFPDYILPKGRIEVNESELDAAKREIEEEAGLNKLLVIKKLGIKRRLTFEKTTWNKYHYFLFITKQKTGAQKLQPGEEDYFVRWFDINNMPSMFWPEQRQLIEENREEIKTLLG
jgi:8-oxo-dGTP pyrophosphatase MutT (NUDIX family)